MAKKTIEIRVNKEDGTLSSKTHGVKGAECLDLLESLLGELTSVETRELTKDYEEEYVAHHTTQSKVDTKQGKGASE
jgi:hypothetical protein